MTSAVITLPSFSQQKLQQLAEAKLTYAVRKANAAVAADVTNNTFTGRVAQQADAQHVESHPTSDGHCVV